MVVDKRKLPDFIAYAKDTLEPNWFTNLRRETFSKISSLKMPDFQKIKYRTWPIHIKKELKSIDSKDNFDSKHYNIIQIGQSTQKIKFDSELKNKGVIITDFKEALQKHKDIMEAYFMKKAIKATENKLTAEHVAFLTSGILIYIPKNVIIKKPLTAYFTQDARKDIDYVHHVLLVAENNSQLSYFEKISTIGNLDTTANIVVEVIALEGSQVKFASIDRLGENTTAYINRRGYLEKDAKIDWSLGMLNDGNIVGDFDSELIGNGSHAETKVIAISTGNKVQGIDTRVTNYGKASIGHILQHGVILQKSRLIFNGIGHVMKNAKGADAQQESRVLMLSRKARGDANPILLIDDNDVSAGHAASVGRVDQQQLYYLMSRGLSKEVAQRLVIRGFLGPVLVAIPELNLRKELSDVIERKLIDAKEDE